jgi:dihydroxy-acid dehydratase
MLAGAIKNVLEKDIKPRDVMTREAFENAITLTIALGGSTNAVIHLLAMAKAVNVDLSLDDFQRISDKTPFIADLKPSGKYLMEDLHDVGGIPAVMKFLLKENFLNGNCLTVTGKTIGENLEEVSVCKKASKLFIRLTILSKRKGTFRFYTETLLNRAQWLKSQEKKVSYSQDRRVFSKMNLKPLKEFAPR